MIFDKFSLAASAAASESELSVLVEGTSRRDIIFHLDGKLVAPMFGHSMHHCMASVSDGDFPPSNFHK